MKKILSFVLIALSIVGAIGGVGYTIYCHAYVITVGVAALAYMAYPKFKECISNLS